MTSTSGYRVELELFSGPLDLLLYLIRRHELDVAEIPLANITAQFLDFLDLLETLDLELIGDFVVTASMLVEMKSRIVLPRMDQDDEEAGPTISGTEPGSDLIRKLLDYKRFKEAAQAIEARAEQWQERYPRLSEDRPRSGKDPAVDRIKEVELWDLVSAFGRILRRQEVSQESRIRYDDTPVSVYVAEIGQIVRERRSVQFTSLFDGQTLRSKIVGMFLAVLELLRHHGFRAEQPVPYGEITILPPLAEAAEPAQASPSAEEADGQGSAADVPAH